MADLPAAPADIQTIPMVSSRRTSKALFYQNLAIALADLRARLGLNVQGPQLEPHVILAAHEEVLYAFDIFQQEVQNTKFPVTSADVWPYYGWTIPELVAELGVSRQTLMRRCRITDGYGEWQGPSSPISYCLAVQWHRQGITQRRMFACARLVSWRQTRRLIRRFMREYLGVPREPADRHLQYYYEVGGRKYGPIATNQDWANVVSLDHHAERINILMV